MKKTLQKKPPASIRVFTLLTLFTLFTLSALSTLFTLFTLFTQVSIRVFDLDYAGHDLLGSCEV